MSDTVEQVKAGNLSMDHQERTPVTQGETPGEASGGQPNITASSSVTRGARDMQSTLSKTFTGAVAGAGAAVVGKVGSGKAEPGEAVSGKAGESVVDKGADKESTPPPGPSGDPGRESASASNEPVPLKGAPADELSTDVKKTSRAERDMAAMKAAPDLKAMVRKEVLAGSVAIGVFLVFLFGWSAMAPLSSAAIAPGVISPHGSRKTVQHLEGGIIERILVEEGSHVAAGDALILLEDTMARASWQLIRTQYYTLAARHARLGALQSGATEVYFPDWLIEEAGDPDVASILATEINLLETRRQAHHDRKAVLQQRIVQLEKEIDGLNAQIDGQVRQLALIAKEIGGVQQLVDKGLERTPRLLGLQRTEAEIRLSAAPIWPVSHRPSRRSARQNWNLSLRIQYCRTRSRERWRRSRRSSVRPENAWPHQVMFSAGSKSRLRLQARFWI